MIDDLVVRLGLDASAFATGAKKVQQDLGKTQTESERVAKEIEFSGKQAAQFFTKMRNEALTLFAVLTGAKGLKDFIETQTAANFALTKSAENLEMGTNHLLAYQRAARDAGSSFEGMTAQLQESQLAVARYKRHEIDESFAEFFARNGKDVDIKSAEGYLKARAELIRGILKSKGEGIAQNSAAKMGISADEYNFIKQGSDAIDEQVRAHERNIGVTEDERKTVAGLRAEWNQLGDQFTDNSNRMFAHFAPQIDEVIKALSRLLAWVTTNADDLEAPILGIGAVFVTAVAGIGTFSGAILALSGALGVLAGTEIYQKFIAGTNAGDILGAFLHGDLPSQQPVKEAFLKIWNHATGADGGINAPGAAPGPAPAGSHDFSGQRSAPRGIRNNNPGNIRYGPWARAHGAIGADDAGFAKFSSIEEGEAATDALIQLKAKQGLGSVSALISSWAPPSENDTKAYIASVSKNLGVGPNDTLNADQLSKISSIIYAVENGKAYASALATTSLPGVARAASAPAAPGNTSTSSTEVTIGKIDVHTQATDAAGIASDLAQHLDKKLFVAQANTGMT